MFRKIKFFLACLIFFISSSLFAQEAGRNVPAEKSVTFLQQIMAGEIEKAYDQVFQGTTILKDKPQAIEYLKKQTTSEITMYGNLLGYEFVSQKLFGNSVIREMYFLKTEKVPIVFTFYYYKTSADWTLTKISFDDDLKVLNNL